MRLRAISAAAIAIAIAAPGISLAQSSRGDRPRGRPQARRGQDRPDRQRPGGDEFGRPGRGDHRRGPDGRDGAQDQPPRPTDPAEMVDRMAKMLTERLDLTTDQQAQLADLVTAMKKSLELGSQSDPAALADELSAARDAGDDARVDEIRQQMRSRAHLMGETASALLDEVEPILTESQAKRLGEIRARMEERRRDVPGDRFQQRVDQLRKALKLDETQQAQFDKIVADYQARAKEMAEKFNQRGDIGRQMRDARQDGDKAKLKALRPQLEELRGQDPRALMDEFYGALEPILNEKQLGVLARFRDRAGAPPRGEDRPLDVRHVLQAARRLDLTDEQQKKIREIETELRRSMRDTVREARQAGHEQRAEMANKVKGEIVEMLDEQQAAEFERMLANHGQRPPEMRGDQPPSDMCGNQPPRDRGRRDRGRRPGPPRDGGDLP